MLRAEIESRQGGADATQTKAAQSRSAARCCARRPPMLWPIRMGGSPILS